MKIMERIRFDEAGRFAYVMGEGFGYHQNRLVWKVGR